MSGWNPLASQKPVTLPTWGITNLGEFQDSVEAARMKKGIFNGQVKMVVVWKLDRLSRRLRNGVNLLADWCEPGLKIDVITQQIESNGPVGRMIAAVMLGLDEIEIEYRREQQHRPSSLTIGRSATKRFQVSVVSR